MIRKHIFSAIIAIVILFLSFTRPSTFEKIDLPDIPYLDKIVHAGMYFVFTLVLVAESRSSLKTAKNYLVLASIPFLFGSTVEILQSLLTKSRTGDIFDACFNLAGIVLAISAWLIFRRLFKFAG
jgi:VanZ family protein